MAFLRAATKLSGAVAAVTAAAGVLPMPVAFCEVTMINSLLPDSSLSTMSFDIPILLTHWSPSSRHSYFLYLLLNPVPHPLACWSSTPSRFARLVAFNLNLYSQSPLLSVTSTLSLL